MKETKSDLAYRVVRSSRRTIAIQILQAGEIVVRSPLRVSDEEIARFVESKRDWIEKHLPRQAEQPQKFTLAELQSLAQQAMEVLPQRIRHFAAQIGVTYGAVTIRSQRSRWGSCSGKGNLNFNCLLMLAPPEVLDYVVVHELCHRKELNHSPRFWAEVARILPDYQIQRTWLKAHGSRLIARLP